MNSLPQMALIKQIIIHKIKHIKKISQIHSTQICEIYI